MGDTAQAPQPPTNPPTGHQMSQQGLAQNDQKCNFWAKLCRFRANGKTRLEICQKFYTTIFLDRNFYTIKTRTSGLFSPTVNQRKCINISYLVLFCVKIYMNV